MTDDRLNRLFSSIREAVFEYFRLYGISGRGLEYKKNREICTRADKDIEKIIIGSILKEFPGHRIISEESGVMGSGLLCWYIDPIDNTVGLMAGERDISVSIALKEGDRYVHSMIINPRTAEIYEASSEGVQKNGQRLSACPDNLFDGRGVSTCAYVRRGFIPEILRIMGKLFEKRIPLRISGGSALDLCYLAEGSSIAHISLGAHTWDVEAGIHMVQSAGGVVKILARFPERNALALLAAANEKVLIQLEDLLGDVKAFQPEVCPARP
jgi:myo-inositol-1(or 4)-monophosphatase